MYLKNPNWQEANSWLLQEWPMIWTCSLRSWWSLFHTRKNKKCEATRKIQYVKPLFSHCSRLNLFAASWLTYSFACSSNKPISNTGYIEQMCCALLFSLSLSFYQLPTVYSPLLDAIGAIADECCVCLEKLYHAQGMVGGGGGYFLI